MAAGKINLQANDGAVVGLVIPDGLGSGERQIALGVNLSGITAYHLLQGNLSVSNEVITNGFSTTLYTGNGTTQAVNTGIDMDTQWGSTVEEKFGGLVWLKDMVSAGAGHVLSDTIRGINKYLQTNNTVAETQLVGTVTAFNNNGFSVGNQYNINLATHASWNFQTTHRITGVTNHGKAITNHYNPTTGFGIAVYTGSGITGHDIQTMLGRKVAFATIKNLSTALDWLTQYRENNYMYLNLTNAETSANTVITNINDNSMTLGVSATCNALNQQYVCYYWANSYYDEANTLIGNYEIGVYQGTGVSGNKVTTKGKPAWVMIKRLDSTGNWYIVDNIRGLNAGNSNFLSPNLSVAESSNSTLITIFNTDGFTQNGTSVDINASGGQYLYMVVYDNDSGSGKSKYPKASDTSNVQINNAIIPFAQGFDSNGTKVSTLSKNETITGLTYTQGKNYVYAKNDGTYGVKAHEPRMLASELVRRYAGESPDYFDVNKNKWFNTDAGSELVTNGKFDVNTSGWTAVNATLGIDNGRMKVTNTSAAAGYAYQALTFVVGKKYRIKATAHYGTAPSFVSLYETAGDPATSNNTVAYTTSGAVSGYIDFIAQQTTYYISVRVNAATAGAYVFIDDTSAFATDITPTTEITESRNYLNHIVHADANGQVVYVEELPKIEYKDVIKANEFRGKNANKVAIAFNGTTTPVTIIGNMIGFATVIRTATGVFDIYPAKDVDIRGLKFSGMTNASQIQLSVSPETTTGKITVITSNSAGSNANAEYISIVGVGE